LSKKRTYCEDDVKQAAAIFYLEGSYRKAAQKTGFPVSTLFYWANNREEWDATIDRIRTEKNEELDALYTELIKKATEELRDRLEHGDCHFDPKTKEIQRVPIKAKDMAVIQAVVFDKRQLLRNLPTSRTERTTVNKLEDLKRRVAALAKPRLLDGECERIED